MSDYPEDDKDVQVPKSALEALLNEQPTQKDQQIEDLQEALEKERDARMEVRFLFIVVTIILLDIVFFSVMDSFGGPLALLILELFVLIPLARKMGMEAIAALLDRAFSRIANNALGED